MSALWLLLACRPDPAPEPDGSETPAAPYYDSGFWEDVRPSSEPWHTADEVAAMFTAWQTEVGLPFSEDTLREYFRWLDLGDTACPGDGPSMTIALSGCTADSGYTYTGIVLYNETDEYVEERGRREVYRGFALADFVFIDLNDERFVGGGWSDVWWRGESDSGEQYLKTRMTGSWGYAGADVPWLRAGASVNLEMENPRENFGTLYLSGSVSSGEYAVYFQSVEIGTTGECLDRLQSGSLWIRQGDGSWYRFDANEDCTQPSTVYWNGDTLVGEATLDASEMAKEIRMRMGTAPLDDLRGDTDTGGADTGGGG